MPRMKDLGAALSRPFRWLNDHLIQVLAWSLAWTLAALLVWRVLFQVRKDGWFDPNHKDLVLLGLVLGLIVLARSGQDLLLRLKKVGPVEFIEKRVDRIVPELKEIGASRVDLDGPTPALSDRLLWEYEKAESYVTHLEWSGLEASGLHRNEKFHDLLLKLSAIALMQDKWARAVDRLELLLKISKGKFDASEVHYRCGIAYRDLAVRAQEKEKAELARKAQDHLRKVVAANPQDRFAFFNLAYVQQVCLKEYELALENNNRAIDIFTGYARARYNRAICYLKLGSKEEAVKEIESIDRNHEDAAAVHTEALIDESLASLRTDPELGERVQKHLRELSPKREPG